MDLAQGQRHVSQQLATQFGVGLLSHQRVPANSCTPQQVTVSLSLSLVGTWLVGQNIITCESF